MEYLDAVQDVISQIPTAPDFVITRAFNRTTRRFCDTTTAFRFKQEDIEPVGDLVTLTPPADTSVANIHLVKWGDKKLDPGTDKFIATIGDTRKTGYPTYHIWREGNEVRLFPLPQKDYNPDLFRVMEAYYNAGVVEARKEATGADRAVPRRVRYGGY